jgi:hypothetical protein
MSLSIPPDWQDLNVRWRICHSWQDLCYRIILAMFALVLLGLFLLVAVASLLGYGADSRDLRPRLPVQAGGEQRDSSWTEQLTHTALPPYRHLRLRRL